MGFSSRLSLGIAALAAGLLVVAGPSVADDLASPGASAPVTPSATALPTDSSSPTTGDVGSTTPSPSATGAPSPSSSNNESPGEPPQFSLIPAFDDDLPNVQRFGPEGALAEGVGAEWVCSVHAADPVKFANTIEADGFQSCSGTGYAPQRINVVLQEYNGLGFWNNLQNNDSGDVWVNFVQRDFIFKGVSMLVPLQRGGVSKGRLAPGQVGVPDVQAGR